MRSLYGLQVTGTQEAGTQSELAGTTSTQPMGFSAAGVPRPRLHSRQSEASAGPAWPTSGGAQPAALGLPAAAATAGALLATLARIREQLTSSLSAQVGVSVSRAASRGEPGWQLQLQRSRQGAYSLAAEGHLAASRTGCSISQPGWDAATQREGPTGASRGLSGAGTEGLAAAAAAEGGGVSAKVADEHAGGGLGG